MNTITLTMEATPENLKKLLQVFDPAPEAPVKAEVKPVTAAPETVSIQEPAAPAPASEPQQETISKADVRAAALELSKAGRKDVLKAIFESFGGKKFSDFDGKPEVYPELMKKIKEAANA